MTIRRWITYSLLGLCALLCLSVKAQHGHLNAGAFGTNQNSKLYFANGDIFAAASGYVKELTYTNGGRYAGYFQGNITFTALPATVANGGPAANHSAFGSFLEAQVVSVEGPAGGAFGFWENGAAAPTFSVGSGSFNTDFRFDLSDASIGAGEPGSDPFGHLHGRRFTATQEGLYTVGFRLLDTSANGLGGQPIHSPSDTFFLNFQAMHIPEPSTLALLSLGCVVAAGLFYRRRN